MEPDRDTDHGKEKRCHRLAIITAVVDVGRDSLFFTMKSAGSRRR
jgi:hypothetical protein